MEITQVWIFQLCTYPSLNTQSCIKGLLGVRDFCFWVVWAARSVKVSFFQKILCCLSDRHILQTFYCPYVLKKCSGAVKCLQNMAIRQVSYYLLKKTYLYYHQGYAKTYIIFNQSDYNESYATTRFQKLLASCHIYVDDIDLLIWQLIDPRNILEN